MERQSGHRYKQANELENPAIDDARTQLVVFQMLYSRKGTAMFAAAAVAAEKRDLKPLAQAASLVNQGVGARYSGDLLSKGSIEVYRYPALVASFAANDNSTGSPFDLLYMSASRYWPIAPAYAGYQRATYDTTPTLLINGDIDVSTPLLFVEAELLPYLPNGDLVVLKYYERSDIARQPGIDAMVATR